MRLHHIIEHTQPATAAVPIPRSQMPQISAEDLSDSHRTVRTEMPIHLLIPVQSERVPGKVNKTIRRIQQGRAKPLVVDCDGHIVNGHHRYDAYQQLGYHSVPVIQVLDADVHQLCDLYRDTTEAALVEAAQLLSQVNERTEVYVDMDGVLADFFGEWARLAGVPHHRDIEDPESALALVRDAEDFWLNLPKTSHADRLLDMVISAAGSYKILSTPLADDARSGPHKIQWVKQNLQGRLPEKVILSHNKAQYATQPDGTPNILIDDYGVNIRQWEAAGGIGFKHKDHKFDRTAKNIQQHLQSASVAENKFDRKPIPNTANLLQSEKPDLKALTEITVKYIKKHCQPWLQSIKKGQVVYRTISAPFSDKKPVFTRAIRTNRRPTDTPLEGHLLFNEIIKIAGGVANRSNSAFVTGDTTFGIPGEGITYTVMPVGDFHYTWSPYYFDWYETFYGDEQDWRSLDLTFSKQKFKQEVDIDAEYKKHNQEWGQQSHSKKQFAEDQFRWWYGDKITTGDATALDHNNIKKLIKADTGLPQAISSGSEIMISASKMLYIDVEFYQSMVSKHILSENPR